MRKKCISIVFVYCVVHYILFTLFIKFNNTKKAYILDCIENKPIVGMGNIRCPFAVASAFSCPSLAVLAILSHHHGRKLVSFLLLASTWLQRVVQVGKFCIEPHLHPCQFHLSNLAALVRSRRISIPIVRLLCTVDDFYWFCMAICWIPSNQSSGWNHRDQRFVLLTALRLLWTRAGKEYEVEVMFRLTHIIDIFRTFIKKIMVFAIIE